MNRHTRATLRRWMAYPLVRNAAGTLLCALLVVVLPLGAWFIQK